MINTYIIYMIMTYYLLTYTYLQGPYCKALQDIQKTTVF